MIRGKINIDLFGHKGFSLLETLIAIFILAVSLVSIIDLFGTSGRSIQKSQNLAIAVSLAHKISQHLKEVPYSSIVDVNDIMISSGVDDGIFNPFENFGNSSDTELTLTSPALKELNDFFQKFDFSYSLQVNSYTYYKSILITIKWVEGFSNVAYQ
ncbi:MAG: prepilin-type N-terminal cleavage/methylation domain-containing protein [Candidatus Riflebacteria bacterium]|nr:prepilin-type N-terminal cleavage/methylation domain-containing protein [Candidatus Riflebacteria bacterium]